MNLLDAVLAFTLVMGALATVVTILMESTHRLIRVRKRNLIDVVRRFSDDLPWLSENERWKLAAGLLNNPMQADKGIPEAKPADSAGAVLLESTWRNRKRGIYDSISLEHVLRHLAELPSVQLAVQTRREQVAAELDRLGGRYQEIRSAMSTDFKRRAQMWSVVVGIGLAFVAHIDGVRIFEAFKNDSELTAAVIAKQTKFEKQAREVQARALALQHAVSATDTALQKLNEARTASPQDASVLPAAEAEYRAKSKAQEAALDALDGAKVPVPDLQALGIPIGWDDSPVPPRAEFDHLEKWLGAWAAWVAKVFITGLLIGLGAPFWFDVAKRLAEVRKAFGGQAPTEERLSGEDPANDAEKRKKLAKRVVDDAASEQTSRNGGLRAPDETIGRIQRRLIGLNFLEEMRDDVAAQEDGVMGPRTCAAIDRFLSAQGLNDADGKKVLGIEVGPDYFKRLLSELDKAGM